MKVFLSWSGQRSKLVAELLNDWLRCVLQAVRPWISSRDIDRGALWFSQISEQLCETGIGIVCLTSENKNRPWILFEAGALAKGLTSSRVCTFLIDLTPTDIEDPLAQFNHTFPTKDSMAALVRTLNASLQENTLDDRVLENVFETYWPQFEQQFRAALAQSPSAPAVERTDDSILKEILTNTRKLTSKVRDLESMIKPQPQSTNLLFSPTRPVSGAELARLGIGGLLNDAVPKETAGLGLRNMVLGLKDNALMQPPKGGTEA
jgi:hypothetical protein